VNIGSHRTYRRSAAGRSTLADGGSAGVSGARALQRGGRSVLLSLCLGVFHADSRYTGSTEQPFASCGRRGNADRVGRTQGKAPPRDQFEHGTCVLKFE
jgi:hypothetical protein